MIKVSFRLYKPILGNSASMPITPTDGVTFNPFRRPEIPSLLLSLSLVLFPHHSQLRQITFFYI